MMELIAIALIIAALKYLLDQLWPLLLFAGIAYFIWKNRSIFSISEKTNPEIEESNHFYDNLKTFFNDRYPEMVSRIKREDLDYQYTGYVVVGKYLNGFYQGDEKILCNNGVFSWENDNPPAITGKENSSQEEVSEEDFSPDSDKSPTATLGALWWNEHKDEVFAANQDAIICLKPTFTVTCDVSDTNRVVEMFEQEGFRNISALDGKITADIFFVV